MKHLALVAAVCLLIVSSVVDADLITPNPNPAGNTITVDTNGGLSSGLFTNLGTIDVAGWLNNTGTLDNDATLNNERTLHNYATIKNYATIEKKTKMIARRLLPRPKKQNNPAYKKNYIT